MIYCQKCKAGSSVIAATTVSTTVLECEHCGAERTTARGPVFFVAGPSGAGKTTAMYACMQSVHSVVHFDVDLLWGLKGEFDSPEDNFAALSSTRLIFAWSLMQSGRPAVLWGAGTPDQTEERPERALFSNAHYLSLVCDDQVLMSRLRSRADFDTYSAEFLGRTVDYVHYLRDPDRNTMSDVLDNSALSPEETAEAVGEWLDKHIPSP